MLALGAVVLLARAAYVQVVCGSQWMDEARKTARHERLMETTRGRVLDLKGRALAEDLACIDACVDYHAIPPDPDPAWVHEIAEQRVHARLAADRSTGALGAAIGAAVTDRKQLVAQEETKVRAEIHDMWALLAHVSGLGDEKIDGIRQAVVAQVALRRRLAWYHKYQQALTALKGADSRSWYHWLLGDDSSQPDMDKYVVEVADEEQSYPILRAIEPEIYNKLGKEAEHLPGLSLRPAMERRYPFGNVAAHLVGQLSRVTREDMAADPDPADPLRSYQNNDLVGRGGLEAMCEPLLRGTRGKILTQSDLLDTDPAAPTQTQTDPRAGADVHTTIDVYLQQEIEKAFDNVTVRDASYENSGSLTAHMHGAAVVIDIATGEVRAMASVPGYDANDYQDQYSSLQADDLNKPLLNRATQSALEPGSTAKLMVGTGAITQGLFTVESRIHCGGYLVINGRQMPNGRCWTMKNFHQPGHAGFGAAPHPTSDLCFPEALERSCNVYFETVADRLGTGGLSRWFLTYGVGRPSGIGIPEVMGLLPNRMPSSVPSWVAKDTTWFAGIGQGWVHATPLQMCNVAATIARNGIWMRPRLLSDKEDAELRAARHLGQRKQIDALELTGADAAQAVESMDEQDVPDQIDLHLSAAAAQAARLGMERVVNSPGGTGPFAWRGDPFFDRLLVAGKTGTAQAAPLRIPLRDKVTGKYLFDDAGHHVYPKDPLTPSMPSAINRDCPWYFAFPTTDNPPQLQYMHSWFIGFAPADKPRIAFAVMVEYGGPGGVAAGSVARQLLAACVEHGYVALEPPQNVELARAALGGFAVGTELLHDIATRPGDGSSAPAEPIATTMPAGVATAPPEH